MKPFSRSLRLPTRVLAAGVLLTLAVTAQAATLMNMTFDNGGANIDEAGGWDGTVATGGSLATGLIVTAAMKINGDFQTQNGGDIFHVDNWHTTNSASTRVGLSLGTDPGYFLNLGDGTGVFSTRLHQHPGNGTDIFNSVELRINGVSVSSQSYTPAGGAQTLVWNLGSNPSLNGLTSATFDLYFTGTVNPVQNTHGPEWSLGDGAFVSLVGNVVPEPSRALLAIAGLSFAAIRRRRA